VHHAPQENELSSPPPAMMPLALMLRAKLSLPPVNGLSSLMLYRSHPAVTVGAKKPSSNADVSVGLRLFIQLGYILYVSCCGMRLRAHPFRAVRRSSGWLTVGW